MCRVCGRMVKCIFDNMPSRAIRHVPSRRAFTTVRRLNTMSQRPGVQSARSPSSLTSAFSSLTIRPSSTLQITGSVRPSIFSAASTRSSLSPITNPSTTRFFSSSATLEAKRDTYDPSRRVQKRRHGFLARIKSSGGRATIKRRRLRRRSALTW